MTMSQEQIEKMIAAHPKRSLQSTLFNIAHAYSRSAQATWELMASSKDADFAAPAIMCDSFTVELLLKFFLAVDHPAAESTDDLKNAGIKLKCHKYSELFDQLLPTTKNEIAKAYSSKSGKNTDAASFRAALIAQGDDPFVYWRYIYETKNVSNFDNAAFILVIDALGNAAAARRVASKT
jgi:hypothetical protein